MAKAIGPSFRVAGIEPPDVRKAAPAARLAFWTAVLAFVMEAKDKELAAGLDRYGKPMRALAVSTIKHRRSAMGPADPHAPPLQPAHGLSRTRALLTGRATPSGVACWWLYDSHTKGSWGLILAHHRAGSKRLPRRDVIGLSPASKAEVAVRAREWWIRYKAGKAAPPVAAKEVYPGGKPEVLFGPAPKPKPPAGVSELVVNAKHYTFQSGNASQVKDAASRGSFGGWRTHAQVKAKLAAQGIAKKADGSYDWAAYFKAKNAAAAPPSPPASPRAQASDLSGKTSAKWTNSGGSISIAVTSPQ